MSYGQKKTVVICDDEQDLLQVFELALESEYSVILASSGKECIDKFLEEKNRGNKVHLILLDYRLGGWVDGKIDEAGRMNLSSYRVMAWKSVGYLPKKVVPISVRIRR
jgi:CheY-like chemotaxis protein